MAETLVNGTTIPQGSDPIHGSGVQAMRNLGGSVDAQLGARYTKAQADALLAGKSPTGHTHSWAQVTGKPTEFPPASHTHPQSDVEGLTAALAATGYDSGERDITSLVPDVTSGRLLVWRLGRTVHLTFDSLIVSAPNTPHWLTVSGVLPNGFRGANRSRYYQFAQQVSSYAAGPIRIDTSGNVVIYNTKQGTGETRVIQGTVSYPTTAALPTTLPGTPA